MKKLLSLLCIGLLACGQGERAGGSSGHENVLQAILLDSNAAPIEGAQAWLRNRAASHILRDTSDATGAIQFLLPDTGEWWLETRADGLGSFSIVDTSLPAGSSITLHPLGALRQCIPNGLPGTQITLSGMERQAILDDAGCFLLDSLPPGSLQWNFADSFQTSTTQHGLRITINPTIATSSPAWLPLRLTGNELDFRLPSVASRIVIFDPMGIPLPISLEEWDSSAQTAILWVRLALEPLSNSRLLLLQTADTASGWLDAFSLPEDNWMHVWHFSRKDTSHMRNLGSVDGAGMVDGGRLFLDSTQGFQVSLDSTHAQQGFLSFWIRIDTLEATQNTRLVSGSALQLVALPETLGSALQAQLALTNGDTLRLQSTAAVGNGDWHLVALQWTAGAQASLYVDGQEPVQSPLGSPLKQAMDSIAFGGFRGAVDELRVGGIISYDPYQQQLDTAWQSRHSTPVTMTRF